MKKVLTTAVLVFTMVTLCLAADISGRWTGNINGQFDVTYDFKVDGEKLTGTSTGPDGSTIPITDGVIKGDDLAFKIKVMDNILDIKGKVKGDVITLSFNAMGNDMSVDLKRAK